MFVTEQPLHRIRISADGCYSTSSVGGVTRINDPDLMPFNESEAWGKRTGTVSQEVRDSTSPLSSRFPLGIV